MTFSEITTYLLEATRRPSAFEATAKLVVNLSIQEASRLLNFNCLLEFADITLTDSGVSWTDDLDNEASSILGVYQLADGVPVRKIPLKAFARLMQEELPNDTGTLTLTSPVNSSEYKAYTKGSSLYLWPSPSEGQLVRVVYYKKPATLVDDSDSNELTINCPELVINLALQKLNNYLQEDERFPISEKQISRSLAAAQQWDSNFVDSKGLDWPL